MDSDSEELDAEVRELLTNYRNARRSSREPCSSENFTQCLTTLQEELNVLNVRYVFNPYVDVCAESSSLHPSALVALINAVFTLLQEHKQSLKSSVTLQQTNHELETTNGYLNNKVERLIAEVAAGERAWRACEAEGLRAAEAAQAARAELRTARAHVALLTARAAATERGLRVQNERQRRENEHLQDKFRDKCGTWLSTGEAREGAVQRLLARESSYKETIGKLQQANRRLADEVLALKDDHLTQSLSGVRLHGD